jgi:ABC-type polysaccharide/polyol phosphate transport system ATPase subunit
VIRLAGVTKDFRLTRKKSFLVHSLVRRLLGVGGEAAVLRALAGVSFSVGAGESVAIVGRNGAGKSTLLSLIVGTILPTSGTIQVGGTVGALLELGVGFHPLLTGRENVYLNASLNGHSNDDIDLRYERIVEFSELAEFMDAPLATYSSGMILRLGFSVAVNLDPDIMIVDEALAVGDEEFQQKCAERVTGMIAAGKTLLFVSHSAQEVARLCRRALWLDHGRLVMDGPADRVQEAYVRFLRTGQAPAGAAAPVS